MCEYLNKFWKLKIRGMLNADAGQKLTEKKNLLLEKRMEWNAKMIISYPA